MNIANGISLLRLAGTPFLLLLAWLGEREGFVWLLALLLLSDALDGYLARRLGLCSELGARLDSWGDLAIYLATPLAIWWLWPEVVAAERVWLLAMVAGFVLPLLLAVVKFGTITSYHTWLDKCAAVLLSIGAVLLLAGYTPWPFRIGVMVLLLAALEEIVITVRLHERRNNIAGVWQLRHERQAQQDTKHERR